MRGKSKKRTIKSPVGRSVRLSIKHRVSGKARRPERRVVFVSYGVPAVTDAEIEIMHAHLQECARRAATPTAHNDNP